MGALKELGFDVLAVPWGTPVLPSVTGLLKDCSFTCCGFFVGVVGFDFDYRYWFAGEAWGFVGFS